MEFIKFNCNDLIGSNTGTKCTRTMSDR